MRVAWAPDEFHLGHIVEIRPEVDRGAQIVQLLRIKYDSDGQLLWHDPRTSDSSGFVRDVQLANDDSMDSDDDVEVVCTQGAWQELNLRCSISFMPLTDPACVDGSACAHASRFNYDALRRYVADNKKCPWMGCDTKLRACAVKRDDMLRATLARVPPNTAMCWVRGSDVQLEKPSEQTTAGSSVKVHRNPTSLVVDEDETQEQVEDRLAAALATERGWANERLAACLDTERREANERLTAVLATERQEANDRLMVALAAERREADRKMSSSASAYEAATKIQQDYTETRLEELTKAFTTTSSTHAGMLQAMEGRIEQMIKHQMASCTKRNAAACDAAIAKAKKARPAAVPTTVDEMTQPAFRPKPPPKDRSEARAAQEATERAKQQRREASGGGRGSSSGDGRSDDVDGGGGKDESSWQTASKISLQIYCFVVEEKARSFVEKVGKLRTAEHDGYKLEMKRRETGSQVDWKLIPPGGGPLRSFSELRRHLNLSEEDVQQFHPIITFAKRADAEPATLEPAPGPTECAESTTNVALAPHPAAATAATAANLPNSMSRSQGSELDGCDSYSSADASAQHSGQRSAAHFVA